MTAIEIETEKMIAAYRRYDAIRAKYISKRCPDETFKEARAEYQTIRTAFEQMIAAQAMGDVYVKFYAKPAQESAQ